MVLSLKLRYTHQWAPTRMGNRIPSIRAKKNIAKANNTWFEGLFVFR